MRLIDADDLWSEIMALPHNGDMISSEEVEREIRDATTVDAVEVVNGRWISVEDRLPEVGQCVLVWCESRMFKKHITISTYMRTYSAERETYFSRRVRNVTHWMPLPQPPKGE